MERSLKIGLVQMSCTKDSNQNQQKISNKVAQLSQDGAELVVLQELHDSLYFCQTENVNHFDLAETIPGDTTKFYSRLAQENKVVLVCSLFEKRTAGLYHNTAVVFEKDGSIAGKYRKMHIPDDPGYYEKFYFTPGDLGFEPISTSLGKIGVLICWDQWYPEAARIMALKGAELLIYPTAIGYDPKDDEDEKCRQLNAWKTIQRSHSIANGIPTIAVNRTGSEASEEGDKKIDFWGNSFVFGPQGETIFEANQSEQNIIAKVSLSRSEAVRRWWPFLRDRRIESYKDLQERFID